MLRVGQRELGHLHGEAVADVPVALEPEGQLVRDEPASEHQRRHEPGWVTVPLQSAEDVQHALALLRANYERCRCEREGSGLRP